MLTIDINAILASDGTDLSDRATRNAVSDMMRDADRHEEAELLAGDAPAVFVDLGKSNRRVRPAANAQDFADDHDHVIFRFASQGQPGGVDIAMLDDTELPPSVDLSAIDGYLDDDGDFAALDVSGLKDWRNNTILGVWLRVDESEWNAQAEDLE